MQLFGLGYISCHISILFSINHIQRWNCLHAKLRSMQLREILGIVCTIEVFSGNAAFGARHVTPDDEVRASIILANYHVLNGLTRSSHVHGVGQVSPADGVVVELLLQHLVSPEAGDAWDVVILSGPAGRVHQADGVVLDVLCVQRACEELVVRPVDRVAALECHHVRSRRELSPQLGRGFAGKHATGKLQPVDFASDVVAAALHGNHLDPGVLQRRGAVAFKGLKRLVGFEAALHLHHSDVLSVVCQQHLHARYNGGVCCVHDDR
mmetsp:Transcript_37207/g.51638  ORF Transcript_37207/g.51638 Transcript_37207/m.51638 type:complete len:266 (+) Transcript_37207:435-1232(+)